MFVSSYTLLLFGLGLVILLVSWLPLALKKLPLSLPIVCVALGVLLFHVGGFTIDLGKPVVRQVTEHLSESIIIIALMGTGLRIDRRFGWRRWGSTWRLLGIAMPLTIAAMTLIFSYGVGFGLPVALLLGAALSPTDPVLAAAVQTGPPRHGDDGETRFGLTSEGGLNDGLALPFVTLALLLARGPVSWLHWWAVDFIAGLVFGALIGWAGGRAMGFFMFRTPRFRLSTSGEGLAAVGAALLCYATATALDGNGFVAVFVSALSIRSICPDSSYNNSMTTFSEQIERALVMAALALFGWSLANGLLDALTWRGAIAGVALLFIVRPAAAWLSFVGSPVPPASKALMGFFGVRGIGTFFYLQYAFNREDFAQSREMWAIVGFAVLSSILTHGVSSTPLMNWADRVRKKRSRPLRRQPPAEAE